MLFNLLGVDYVQWKAVSRAVLRTDFRVPLSPAGEAYPLSTARGLLMLMLVHSGIGLASAAIVLMNRDPVLTGTLVLTYLAFALAATLLTQHGPALLSGADHAILAPRPVTSRTFLAIRLTNVLVHTWLVTLFIALPAVAAFAFAHGRSYARGAAAAVAIFAWATMLALMLAAAYGVLLERVGATRLQRALAYMQLLAGIFMYGGVLVALRTLTGRGVSDAALPEPWPWLLPPAWFASYMPVATGDASAAAWGRAALSIAAVAALVNVLKGRLGADYAQRLGEMVHSAGAEAAVRAQHQAATPSGTWPFGSGEARAVALLVLAHFRHDLRVRMGILGILPLLVFYLVLGAGDGGADPFAGVPEQSFDYIGFAVLLFPALLTQQFSASDAYRASWIFGATPVDRSRLVLALKKVAVLYFLMPFLLLVAAVFTWRYAHAAHAFAHAAILGLVSYTALVGSMALKPSLPFAHPPDKMSGSARLIGWLMFVLVGGQLLLWTLPRLVYVSWARTAALAALLVTVGWAFERALVRRARAIAS